MSFALTTLQVCNKAKDVTRRLGWVRVQPGLLVQPVVKAQGLKKGQHVEKIGGPIRLVSVRREALSLLLERPAYGRSEVIREGFYHLTPLLFVEMFCEHNRVTPSALVTRIEFEYVLDGVTVEPVGSRLITLEE